MLTSPKREHNGGSPETSPTHNNQRRRAHVTEKQTHERAPPSVHRGFHRVVFITPQDQQHPLTVDKGMLGNLALRSEAHPAERDGRCRCQQSGVSAALPLQFISLDPVWARCQRGPSSTNLHAGRTLTHSFTPKRSGGSQLEEEQRCSSGPAGPQRRRRRRSFTPVRKSNISLKLTLKRPRLS